ncbi:MAG: MoxR family ATPase [Chloroflexota bacterium]
MADTTGSNHWFVYGHDQGKEQLAEMLQNGAPPWRDFANTTRRTAYEFLIDDKKKQVINAAIYLRRPLLVTGDPGTGKSSLAYSIAKELELDKVLVWPITSRSTLRDALYRYDAIGRLQQANLGSQNGQPKNAPPPIEKYLTLGPLGTAFADCREWPRVLLIDEIDKSDIDLPNDLLYIFEEGEFEIPELSRLVDATADEETTPKNELENHFEIRKHNAESPADVVTIKDGWVRCKHFPIVIMTSNGERELPAPFLRRCLRLPMEQPDQQKLLEIVGAHFTEYTPTLAAFIKHIMDEREKGELVATDQLMNAIYLAQQIVLSNSATGTVGKLSKADEERIKEIVLKSISRMRR